MRRLIASGRIPSSFTGLCCLLMGVVLALHASELHSGRLAGSSLPEPVPPSMCPIPAQAVAPEVAAISHDIARRFHLAKDAALSITREAFSAARIRGIDPTLVLAVAAIESRFKPQAVNPLTGAKGLMQVMPRWHQDKIVARGGDPSLGLIAPNITIGTAILAEYLEAEDGDLEAALGHYLGTMGGVTYVRKVRREMAHLARILDAV